jgi:hypothetical protein
MADEYPSGYPTPPTSPAKDLPEPAKPKSLHANAVRNINSEGFSVKDLSTDTTGPIGNQATVHQAINRQVEQRNATSKKMQAADEKQRSRPYITGRSLSK